MESVVNKFWEAHHELMEQTGWGDIAANLSLALRATPDAVRELVQEAKFFRYAINWNEPFFKYLAAFHVVLYAMVLYAVFWRWQPTRPRPEGVSRAMELARSHAEEKLFALSMALVLLSFSAYPLNRLGAKYGAQLFVESGVNYFDDNILFVGVVYWFPLVLLSLLVQLKLLFNVVRLMAVAKGEQMRARQKAREAAAAAAANEESAEAQKKNS